MGNIGIGTTAPNAKYHIEVNSLSELLRGVLMVLIFEIKNKLKYSMNKLLLKTILYRVGAIILSFGLFLGFFGSIRTATAFTIMYELAHTIWYLSYEILWKKYKHRIYK